MHQIIILESLILSQEKHHCDVEQCKSYHFEVYPFSKHTKQHPKNDSQVASMFILQSNRKVFVAKGIDQKYPFLKELRDGLCIPPI